MEASKPRSEVRGRRRRRPIDVLTPAEVARLIDACSRRTSTGLRDAAVIATLYATGARVSEILALRVFDIDVDERSAVVQNGKGDRRRTVGMFEDAVEPLLRWLGRRRELGVDDRCPIFCTITRGTRGAVPTRPGRPISREHVGRMLRRLARRVGLLKRVHPHGFRHAHCSLLRSRGLDVYAIKSQCGHQNLSTTDQYLRLLGSHELPERLRRIGPVLQPTSPDPRTDIGELVRRMSLADAERLVAVLRSSVPA